MCVPGCDEWSGVEHSFRVQGDRPRDAAQLGQDMSTPRLQSVGRRISRSTDVLDDTDPNLRRECIHPFEDPLEDDRNYQQPMSALRKS